MKKNIIIFLFILLAFCSYGQQCSNYFLLKEGSKIEMQSLDKKGKLSSILKYHVQKLKPSNGGFAIQMLSETFDAKGKLIVKGEVNGKCQNGDLYTDIQNISTDMFAKTADLKMKIDGDQMVYPAQMKTGDKLKDASISISSSLQSGMSLMNITANITNRKVLGTEKTITPAGEFECIKMTYDMEVKMFMKRELHIEEYFYKGIGIVKSNTFDTKGKLVSSLVLSKLEK